MPVWDGAAVWDGSKTWGFSDAPVSWTTAAQLWSTALALRTACFELFSVEESTLTWQAPIDVILQGGLHRADIQEERWRADRLEWTIATPDGSWPATLAPNALVGLQWHVWGGGVEQTYQGGVYRIATEPTLQRTVAGVTEVTFQGDGWLQELLTRGAQAPARGLVGLTPLTFAVLLKVQTVLEGSPIIGAADTWATVTAALLWELSGHHVRVVGDWDSVRHPDVALLISGEAPDPLAQQAGQTLITWQRLIDFCAFLGRVEIGMDPDGWIRLREQGQRVQAPWAITCANDPAHLVVPVEAPLTRQRTRPEFTDFEVWWAQMVATPPNVGGPAQTLQLTLLAHVAAPGVPDALRRTRVEVTRGGFATPMGSFADYTSVQRYAAAVLRAVLARADQLSVRVDNAFPAAQYLGDEWSVDIPDIATGPYRLVSVQQPLTADAATLNLQRWE